MEWRCTVVDGAESCGRDADDEDDVGGTSWKLRATSCWDILDGGFEFGGGVSPSSDLTSGTTKGTGTRSSPIFSNELIDGASLALGSCDHKAFRCSGLGLMTFGDHDRLDVIRFGLKINVASCRKSVAISKPERRATYRYTHIFRLRW